MINPSPDPLGSPGVILRMIQSRRAKSRADIARYCGLSASTASARVERLIKSGYVRELDTGSPAGGRRPRQLEISPSLGHVAAVNLGGRHATITIADMSGMVLSRRQVEVAIDAGPERVLSTIAGEAQQLAESDGSTPLLALTVGVPGPVDQSRGVVISPSRMPGWNGAAVGAILQQSLDVPVIVENDANLMALGEYESAGSDVRHMVLLKAGSGIGCGIIASGALFHGSRGLAGDISHTTVPDADPVPCSCGRTGCLDAVASGTAVIRALNESGVEVNGPAELLRLAGDAHPVATNLLREAGARTGVVLATVISFFNPDRLVLGGHLSHADAFVAGVHSAIYSSSLPMTTESLDITVGQAGAEAAGYSGISRAIDHVLSPSLVNARLKARA